MAVVSDAVYSARSPAVSYVSSNAYYGYVPPCRKQNQPDYSFEISGIGDSSAVNHCIYGSAMETDDDGCDYSRTSRRLNNHCVIPEVTARNRLEIDQWQQQNQQLTTCDTGIQQRRNRKRCSTDLAPARELKKFREGGGNSRVYRGTTSATECGLATMYYETTPLHLNSTTSKIKDQSTGMIESCCWAAGNPSSINNADYKHFLSSNGSKPTEGCTEYEKMLFETHGCSIYHQHRLQFLDNYIETEF